MKKNDGSDSTGQCVSIIHNLWCVRWMLNYPCYTSFIIDEFAMLSVSRIFISCQKSTVRISSIELTNFQPFHLIKSMFLLVWNLTFALSHACVFHVFLPVPHFHSTMCLSTTPKFMETSLHERKLLLYLPTHVV